jgi:DNA-binding PadR family transcriptional regulator
MAKRVSAPVVAEFELLVLLAVIKLGEGAYPGAVAEEIERSTDRKASRPAVLITLARLEEKGLLSSYFGDPTPVRGGRAKRLFSPKPLGRQAVKQALERIGALARGLESEWAK